MKQDQETRFAVTKALGERGIRVQDGNRVLSDPAGLKVLMEQTGKLAKLDERNRTRLEQIVDRFGWSGKALAGKDGAAASWLLVRHADGNLAFQKRCLRLMRASPWGDVEAKHITYLTDRIL